MNGIDEPAELARLTGLHATFATIRDRQSGKPDYNPVSSYRRTFTVPKEWEGRRVILRFDGVYSAYNVWVNGRKVGYAEDSKLPSEFDITDVIGKREEGTGNREQGKRIGGRGVQVVRRQLSRGPGHDAVLRHLP